jgi:hypothetical protein
MVLAPSVAGLFKWRQFEPEVILLAIGWYLRFSLSYRDVEELLAEWGLRADHVTVWRWVQRYAPELERRFALASQAYERLVAGGRDPNVGLVHPPTVVGRSEPQSQSTLNFRGVTLDPPPDGNVVDQKSALSKEFLDVTVRKGKAQIPADRQEDDLRLKLPPLE